MNHRLTEFWARLKKEGRAGAGAAKPDAPAPAGGRDLTRVDPVAYVGDDAAAHERVVRERFAAKAKRYLRQLPLAHETVALYFCLLDARTPVWVKAVVGTALAYFILPVDAVPDLLPLVGLSDDASVIAAALTAVSSHVTDEHRTRARAWMADEHLGPEGSPSPAV